MTKPRLIIWGGNNRPLKLGDLDSHASVNAFFLTKYLRQHYEIVNLVDLVNENNDVVFPQAPKNSQQIKVS